jgi:hypothetical protein
VAGGWSIPVREPRLTQNRQTVRRNRALNIRSLVCSCMEIVQHVTRTEDSFARCRAHRRLWSAVRPARPAARPPRWSTDRFSLRPAARPARWSTDRFSLRPAARPAPWPPRWSTARLPRRPAARLSLQGWSPSDYLRDVGCSAPDWLALLLRLAISRPARASRAGHPLRGHASQCLVDRADPRPAAGTRRSRTSTDFR